MGTVRVNETEEVSCTPLDLMYKQLKTISRHFSRQSLKGTLVCVYPHN